MQSVCLSGCEHTLCVDLSGVDPDGHVCDAGKEYEARLRQQHSKLNPRTSWATEGRAKRKRGFGDEESEDDE